MQRRTALTQLWGGESVKDATVDKIRCSFALDTTRAEPIPEEEAPPSPFSPEPMVPASATTPAARFTTPAVTGPVDGTPMLGSPPVFGGAQGVSTTGVSAGEVQSELASERASMEEERRAVSSQFLQLRQAMEEQQQLTRTMQARLEAVQTEQRVLRQQLEKQASLAPATRRRADSLALLLFVIIIGLGGCLIYLMRLTAEANSAPREAPLIVDTSRDEL
uniref:Uncharacterized protein n=1 Tax=Haptolina ericina TaxID=156174 RepID=A0A7S3AD45_9EUKA|mmetsp:Transcript_10001/g.22731  ORF Transcript_10001/g.22731 Transcript_10001/m.22731 type:complete len:220 (+) Transcript_10001:529-1188(+)